MMALLSVGLPLVAMAALVPVHLAWEAMLNRYPAIETAFEKATAFNPFDPTR